jgi:NAD+ synthase (glutamine-hydrolysing)
MSRDAEARSPEHDTAQRCRDADPSSPEHHGFARVAAAVPHVQVADPDHNARRTIALAQRAAAERVALVVFPELGLSSYAIDDLLRQRALLDGVLDALALVVRETCELRPLIAVGAPLRAEGGLFNCAILIHRGEILGVVPKSYLPEYREFYEKRQFRSARDAVGDELELLGRRVPFGSELIFDCVDLPGLAVHVEICEDLWVPIPPSSYGALAGATVLANLSASNVTVGKDDYRRELCRSQSARTISAYIYTAAGMGESTTDLAWDGHAIICENGTTLAETERFSDAEQLAVCDVDLDRLAADRMATTTYGDSIGALRRRLGRFRRIEVTLGGHASPTPSQASPNPLRRPLERFPYVPSDPRTRDERCAEVYNIQVRGLQTRMAHSGVHRLVIGVSGGLDSAQALIVCVRAVERLGLSAEHVLAYTLPGFATSRRTLQNARELMAALGVSAGEIDIRPAAERMLADISHPVAAGEPRYDVTYENVQAGERTSHLFRLANLHGALVVGTGDLSELALGWCTYGVGDQMSHYAVNASVPKTLIQFLLRWQIDTGQLGERAAAVVQSILDTEISPELVPAGDGADVQPAQLSESVVGPYELADFFLYYTLRFGYAPSKVAYLAEQAWGDRERGAWPDLIPPERRVSYSEQEIRHWLREFLRRFFSTSQFKRSAIPNAPKVGSGGSLSPRSDWRAPSDSSAAAWLAELDG